MAKRILILVACVASFGPAGSWVERAWAQQSTASASSSEEADFLSSRGFTVTKGAAPGYAEDGACATCHNDLYESYQEVGLAVTRSGTLSPSRSATVTHRE